MSTAYYERVLLRVGHGRKRFCKNFSLFVTLHVQMSFSHIVVSRETLTQVKNIQKSVTHTLMVHHPDNITAKPALRKKMLKFLNLLWQWRANHGEPAVVAALSACLYKGVLTHVCYELHYRASKFVPFDKKNTHTGQDTQWSSDCWGNCCGNYIEGWTKRAERLNYSGIDYCLSLWFLIILL